MHAQFKISIGLICSVLVIIGCEDRTSQKITTLILVRHSEKANDGTDDPELSPKGTERSNRLAQHLKDTDIQGIYATDYKRTRNTVAPLASAKDLKVEIYEAHKELVIEDIVERHRGGTVVICGHSNSIPWTANLLLGKEQLKEYAEK